MRYKKNFRVNFTVKLETTRHFKEQSVYNRKLQFNYVLYLSDCYSRFELQNFSFLLLIVRIDNKMNNRVEELVTFRLVVENLMKVDGGSKDFDGLIRPRLNSFRWFISWLLLVSLCLGFDFPNHFECNAAWDHANRGFWKMHVNRC